MFFWGGSATLAKTHEMWVVQLPYYFKVFSNNCVSVAYLEPHFFENWYIGTYPKVPSTLGQDN